MKQKQPKFSGILVVAVLMVLVLFIVSLSPLLAASGSKDTTYSEIYYYFENQQVTSFRLDLGTGSLELWLKEGKAALPESNAAASLPTGGLLTGVYSSGDNALPANGGTVYMTYKLPYGGDFNTGKISDFVDEYNAANPDAPMVFDYVAAKTSIPWLEIIFYVAMLRQHRYAVHVDVPRRRGRRHHECRPRQGQRSAGEPAQGNLCRCGRCR